MLPKPTAFEQESLIPFVTREFEPRQIPYPQSAHRRMFGVRPDLPTQLNPIKWTDMPVDSDAVSAANRGRSRLWVRSRVLLWGLSALILCAAISHKQALRFLVLVYAKSLAARSGLVLETQISGNVFSGLDFKNTRLTSKIAQHETLKEAEIKSASFQYDLCKLISGDIRRAIKLIRINDARLNLHQLPTRPNPNGGSEGLTFTDALRSALDIPGLFADNVELKDITVEVDRGCAVRSVRQLDLSAIEGQAGHLSIGRIVFANAEEFGPINSPLTYKSRRLTIGPLEIDRELQITAFSFGGTDAEGIRSVALAIRADDGIISVALSERSAVWRLELTGKQFPVGAVLKRFGFAHGYATELQSLQIHAEGNPTKSQSWNGSLSLQVAAQMGDNLKISSEIEATLDAGNLKISSARAYSAESVLKFEGAISVGALPFSSERVSGDLFFEASVDELSEWQPLIGISLRGRAQASLAAKIHEGLLELKPRIVGREISVASELHSMHSKALSAEGTLNFTLKELLSHGPSEGAAAYEKRSAAPANTLTLTYSEAAFNSPKFQINADAASCDFFLAHNTVRGERLLITRGENKVAGAITIGFEKAESFKLTRAAANLEIKCPLIRGESLVFSQHALTGTIQGSLSAQYDGKAMEGGVSLHGTNLQWGRLGIPTVRINGNAFGGTFRLQELYASLGAEQTIQCTGQTELVEPFAYQLDADVRLAKLDSVQSFLEQAGMSGPLSGGVEAAWKGSGKLTNFSGSGEWKLHGKNLRWKSLKLDYVDFEGTYSPGQLRAHTAKIAGPNARLSAEAAWSKNTLHLSNISLQQKGSEVLVGEIRLPLSRDSEGTHWMKDGLIEGVLRGSKIDLANVVPSLDGKPIITGSLGLSLNLSGTAENPVVRLSASGRSLRTACYPSISNCEIELDGQYASGTIHSDAVLSGPFGTPLRVQAKAAVDLDELLGGRIDWAALPVELSAKITDAKLQTLPKFFPKLREIKGVGTLDARMRGSFRTPIWEGGITIDCDFVHFQTDRIPAITDLHANVKLDGKHLHISRARADIGGGGLQAEGTVIFENPKNPTLRIDVKAQQVLVQRTEQLSLRLDGNLHAEGTWDSAVVTGKLFAVKRMVRRDIELLPITSMQSGGSGYKRPPGKPWFTFPVKPLSDWKLNIHILTQPGDPVQIRGNRLRGTAKVDVHLLGTGAAPTLEGSYISDDVVALLPFARVEVSRGRVWYSADAPFLPQTEFTAESEIRNHRIRMYLHGPPENPQISVSSDPPLAERDALTLLTAGVLPGDFASESSQAASSRAASLLAQEFSDKVLLKGGANERFSALRRFSLDVGALNSRTGNQETRLTYRLQDNLFMIGEIGANGDFATRLRYIFRFY